MNEPRSDLPRRRPDTVGYRNTVRYAVLGVAFGLFFPLLATIITLVEQELSLTFRSIVDAQLSFSLLWIIDSAPLFLGLFAALVGQREDRLRVAARRLQRSVNSLEERVEERTRALSRAFNVGRQIGDLSDLGQLLVRAAELTRTHFELDKVDIYLTDELGGTLALQTSSDASPSEMPVLRRRVPLGFDTTIGTAAIERRTVVGEAGQPERGTSRGAPGAVAAVPMTVGERLIGVLNLAAGRERELSAESLVALEILAGQLGAAVDNARLISETRQAREELELQTRRMARVGWQEFFNAVDRAEMVGYRFDLENVDPLPASQEGAGAHQQMKGVPITIAGEHIGQIEVAAGEGDPLSESESELVAAVAKQVAQQVENLRLLAEADRYRDEAETATRRLTRQGWDEFLSLRQGGVSGYAYHMGQVTALPLAPDEGGVESSAASELVVRGEPIGRLEVVEEGAVDEGAVELVASVAAQLSTHLENLRLSEQTERALAETERQASRLQALNELGQALAGAATTEDVYRIAAIGTRQIVPAERTSIAMLMENGKNFQILALHGEKGVSRVGDVVSAEGSALGIAIREKRVVVVSEKADSGFPGVSSFVVAPLTAGGRTFGTLNAGHSRPNAYGDQDARLLLQVASLLASTLESRRLFAQTQRRAEELAILNEMGRALTSLTQTEQVAQSVYDHTCQLMEARSLSIVQYEPEHNELDIREYGEGQEGHGSHVRRPAGRGLVQYVIQSRQPLLIDGELAGKVADLGLEAEEPLPRSWLGVPMATGGAVTGAIVVQNFDRSGAFSEHEQDLLAAVASQAAIALENARLFEQVQARARRERILREVTARVRGTTNIDSIMRTAVKEVGEALGRQSFVYLGNGESNPRKAPAMAEEEEYGNGK